MCCAAGLLGGCCRATCRPEPRSTAGFRWHDTGPFETLNHLLVIADRERVEREASPTAAVIDSQSVKTTESGRPQGYDASKKVKGRKRQVMVDTDGRALILEPQPADVLDRDGAPLVLRLSRRSFPFIAKAFADAGYSGDRPATATSIAGPDSESDELRSRFGGAGLNLG